jgi:hypothetical protein
MMQCEDLALQSNPRSETAMHRGEQAKEEILQMTKPTS